MSKTEKKAAEPAKAEEKAVTPVQSALPAEVMPTPSDVIAADIIIPKLLLMQGMSEFVAKRQCQLGDIVRSTTREKMGDPEHSVPFIPLSRPESWWIIEVQAKGKDKYEYSHMIRRDSQNSGLPWNFFSDDKGQEVPESGHALRARRVQRLMFYALLPGDIKAQEAEISKAEKGEFADFGKTLMPVVISCRSLSFQAGKEVVTWFTQVEGINQELRKRNSPIQRKAWEAILKLGCRVESNDKGTFYVYTVDRAKPEPVSKEDLSTVAHWASIVSTTKLRVDESVDEDAASTTTGQTQF